ncbi:MAG TPA: flavocytochrome c [Terriglobales bacterium]|nr:flavocytochrome c [Terriglobales bacterium]
MRKSLALLVALCLMLGMFAGCTTSTGGGAAYKAGEYTASAKGMGGDVTLKGVFSDNAIDAIEVVSQNETPGVSDPAFKLIDLIVANQSLGVDTVAGCTISSTAIITAVTDLVTQAGGDVEALKKVPIDKTATGASYEADIVVLGAGGAGMAAAVTASELGKKVVVIEASSAMGGNTIMSGGALNASNDDYVPETKMSSAYAATIDAVLAEAPKNDDHAALLAAVKAEYEAYKASGSDAVFDSVNWHILQTWRGGDYEGDLALVKILCTNIWDGVEWLGGMGMEYLPGEFTVTGGLWPRAHKPAEPVGTGFFKTYGAYVDAHDNITMVYNTRATDLIVEDGKVVGATCEGPEGSVVTAKGAAVVLATGGFSRNVEMRQKYNAEVGKWPSLDAAVLSTNAVTNDGHGIEMAQALGAALTQMGNIQLLPLGDPVTGALAGNIEHDVETRIFVNKEGERFVNEGGRRDDMTLGLIDQPDKTMFIVMDSDTYPTGDEVNNFGETVSQLVEAGRAYKADTVAELAGKMGVPADALQAALDDFNSYCAGGANAGKADAFGRTLFSTPIDTAPFYAAARVPTVHHTMGGVVIDAECHVLTEAGAPIPGLYAAGEVTGGIHGANRLGGNALADTVVFGRIAGASAAGGK